MAKGKHCDNSVSWGTERERRWLESVARRHGLELPENQQRGNQEYFDGITVLRGWLETCDKRVWPGEFNLASVRETARNLLNGLEAA